MVTEYEGLYRPSCNIPYEPHPLVPRPHSDPILIPNHYNASVSRCPVTSHNTIESWVSLVACLNDTIATADLSRTIRAFHLTVNFKIKTISDLSKHRKAYVSKLYMSMDMFSGRFNQLSAPSSPACLVPPDPRPHHREGEEGTGTPAIYTSLYPHHLTMVTARKDSYKCYNFWPDLIKDVDNRLTLVTWLVSWLDWPEAWPAGAKAGHGTDTEMGFMTLTRTPADRTNTHHGSSRGLVLRVK